MSVWEFLNSWPVWFQIVFSVLVLTVIFVIIRKGIEISRGKFKLKIGGILSDKKEEFVSPHRNCPHSKDIIILLNEVDKLRYEKWNLLYIDQLRNQMNYAEQKSEQIKSILQKKYLKLLESKKVPQIVSSESYAAYQTILKNIVSDLLRLVRISFKENHFDEINDKEFSIYVNDKSDYIINKATDFLNDTYFFHRDIPREELYEENQEIVPKIKEMIIDAFDHARMISAENKVKLMELDERMDRLVSKYI